MQTSPPTYHSSSFKVKDERFGLFVLEVMKVLLFKQVQLLSIKMKSINSLQGPM